MGILEWVQQSMTFTLSNLHFTKNQILQKKELTEEETDDIIVKLTARCDIILQRTTSFWKNFQNKIKKLLTNRTTHDKISELSRLR